MPKHPSRLKLALVRAGYKDKHQVKSDLRREGILPYNKDAHCAPLAQSLGNMIQSQLEVKRV
jgi:hypothetical protein